MDQKCEQLLRSRLQGENYQKLMDLPNPKLHRFIADAIELCDPATVVVCTDDSSDIAYVRKQAVARQEETPLTIEGHTVHFDGYFDQGRDKDKTKYLVPPGMNLGERLNTAGKAEGTAEVRALLKGQMAGREAYVRFFCLGPVNSAFSISGVQITDSAYVGHSEDLLYRSGYEQFKRLGDGEDFFRVMHSCGELTEGNVSKNYEDKRIYIDLEDELVYSVNTQYGGNTIGFKKLALRLAIRKADREGWLSEHMFVVGIHGPKGRKTYFTGAFPSACGKTSTAMLPGESIVGDDIAYLRIIDGEARAVNVESGIFGIIQDVNSKDDPVIYKVLTTPGEVIFSNILIKDGKPYWLGMGQALPKDGVNYAGQWHEGMKGPDGATVSAAHKNARYTVSLRALANVDPKLDDPDGIAVSGIIYGGRDSDTWVPVQQSLSWDHGVIAMGASLESETTAATIGQEGVRAFQPMSNLDFVAIPLGKYIQNHLDFAKGLKEAPTIFAVNYFLKGADGKYLNGMADKAVWAKWMERRVNGEVEAIEGPTGWLPVYADLKALFKDVLKQEYTPEQYAEQFSIRVPENIKKIDRIEEIYRTQVPDTPQIVFDTLAAQRKRLQEVQAKFGDRVHPEKLR